MFRAVAFVADAKTVRILTPCNSADVDNQFLLVISQGAAYVIRIVGEGI